MAKKTLRQHAIDVLQSCGFDEDTRKRLVGCVMYSHPDAPNFGVFVGSSTSLRYDIAETGHGPSRTASKVISLRGRLDTEATRTQLAAFLRSRVARTAAEPAPQTVENMKTEEEIGRRRNYMRTLHELLKRTDICTFTAWTRNRGILVFGGHEHEGNPPATAETLRAAFDDPDTVTLHVALIDRRSVNG